MKLNKFSNSLSIKVNRLLDNIDRRCGRVIAIPGLLFSVEQIEIAGINFQKAAAVLNIDRFRICGKSFINLLRLVCKQCDHYITTAPVCAIQLDADSS